MKNIKKCLVASVAMLMGVGVLTACDGGDDRTQVIFWHTMGKSNQAILNRWIEQFEADNPDIHITHAAKGDYSALKTAVETAISAGDTPTMAYCYPDHVAGYMSSRNMLDLTSFVNGEETKFSETDGLQSDFVDAYWNEGTDYQEEGIYSVPFSKSTEVMFYNKDVFETKQWSVPTTWEEMETLCATIKADEDYGDVTPFGYDSDSNLFITLCEQYGIPYTTNENIGDNVANHFKFNNPQAKAMVTRVKSWYDNGYIATQGTMASSSYTSTLFTAGTLLMTIGSTGGTQYNASSEFTVGVAPIPGADVQGGNDHVISQGPSVCFFRRTTEAQRLASWKFYKYMVRKENSAEYSMDTGYAPVRKSSFEVPTFVSFYSNTSTGTYKEKLVKQAIALYGELSDKFYVSPAFKGSSTARDEVGGIISNVCLGTKTVDKAFSDAYNNCLFAA